MDAASRSRFARRMPAASTAELEAITCARRIVAFVADQIRQVSQPPPT